MTAYTDTRAADLVHPGAGEHQGSYDTKKLHILQHAIGRDQHGQPRYPHNPNFRNHFVTGPGSHDHPTCLELVAEGLMTRSAPSALTGGDDCFHVTDAGRAWVIEHSPPPPKLTRSQRRYRAWAAADSSMSFGEWLRSPYARTTEAA